MGKIKLDKDGLKGIFINHVEKMILGIVLLVFGVFVYSSLGLEGLPSGQTPDKLIQSAQAAEKSINNPENWKQVVATVTVPSGYVERAKNRLIPTNAQLYAGVKPISPSYPQEGSKRPDPKLLPPEKVEVYALTGGVVVMMTNPEEDTLVKEKNATITPKVDPAKKKKKKEENYGYPSGKGGSSAMSAAMGSAMGSSAMGSSAMGSSAMSGMMPGMSGSGMGGMPGSDATGGVATMANPLERPGFAVTQGAAAAIIAKSRSCVAVKVVLPWKKQWEEYDHVFSTALGFNPARDTPRYISFTAERIEVSDDPSAPLDWSRAVKVAYPNKTFKEVREAGYAGFVQELADPRYLQIGLLTFPIPPFVNRDPEPLALHSDVPKMSANMMQALSKDLDKDGKKKKTEKKKTTEESDDPGTMPAGGTPDGSGGYPGMTSGFPGAGMSGMGDTSGSAMMGMGGMGMSGMSGSAMMGMGSGGMSGMTSMGMGSMGMSGMSGMSADGSAGMSMSGGFGYGDPNMNSLTRGPVVPYLLVRFFDFSVEPGKKYRYRVQAVVEDPNHPQLPQFDPSDRYLDDAVKKRLMGQVSPEEKAKKQRVYYLRTDWSQPSDPVAVEIRPRALAGKVEALKFGAAVEKNQDKLLLEEPQAKIMSVVWDAARATEVTGVTDVFRGSYLNFKANGDAIHPILLMFKLLENYNFQTDQLVADIRGGEELAGKDKEQPLLSLGQYALVDDKGQIVVRNEFDDWDDYRKLTLPEPAESSIGMAPGGDEGMMTPGGPGMMTPGMGGPGAAKKARKGGSTSGSGT